MALIQVKSLGVLVFLLLSEPVSSGLLRHILPQQHHIRLGKLLTIFSQKLINYKSFWSLWLPTYSFLVFFIYSLILAVRVRHKFEN